MSVTLRWRNMAIIQRQLSLYLNIKLDIKLEE